MSAPFRERHELESASCLGCYQFIRGKGAKTVPCAGTKRGGPPPPPPNARGNEFPGDYDFCRPNEVTYIRQKKPFIFRCCAGVSAGEQKICDAWSEIGPPCALYSRSTSSIRIMIPDDLPFLWRPDPHFSIFGTVMIFFEKKIAFFRNRSGMLLRNFNARHRLPIFPRCFPNFFIMARDFISHFGPPPLLFRRDTDGERLPLFAHLAQFSEKL